MDKSLIIANWKMNPETLAEAKALLNSVQNDLTGLEKTEVVFCSPFIFLDSLAHLIVEPFQLGSQNVFYEERGAFTGEISPVMLKKIGCQYVIIGHSERKQYLGEADELINKKVLAALKNGLKPILCLGEKDKDASGVSDILKTQLEKGLTGVDAKRAKNLIITYEPVWAISTSENAAACQPDDALVAGLFIRKILAKLFGRRRAEKIPILYGGSVDSKNAASYIKEAQLNGLLVGNASLKAKEFVRIIKSLS